MVELENRHPDDARASGAQRTCRQIRGVLQFARRPHHAFGGRRDDARIAAQRIGRGGPRYARGLGYIAHRDHMRVSLEVVLHGTASLSAPVVPWPRIPCAAGDCTIAGA